MLLSEMLKLAPFVNAWEYRACSAVEELATWGNPDTTIEFNGLVVRSTLKPNAMEGS